MLIGGRVCLARHRLQRIIFRPTDGTVLNIDLSLTAVPDSTVHCGDRPAVKWIEHNQQALDWCVAHICIGVILMPNLAIATLAHLPSFLLRGIPE